MRRIKIIITAVCLAIIGAIIPMMAALFFAWHFAYQDESQILYEYTSRMLTRAKATLNDVRVALFLFENKKHLFPICSPQHLTKMSEISQSIIGVSAISYDVQGTEACSDTGISQNKLLRPPTTVTLPDGLEVGATKPSSSNSLAPMMTFRSKTGNYNIFIRPSRLADIIIPSDVWLGIIFDSHLVTSQNTIDPNLLKELFITTQQDWLAAHPHKIPGDEQLKPATNLKKDHVFLLNKRMICISQYGPFYFIAAESKGQVYQRYKDYQKLLLPLGLISALFIIWLVIYFSKKRLSFKSELQEALNNNEFFTVYQPIISTTTGQSYGAEALVRWKRPTGEIVRPDLFIPLAEEVGMISAITKQVIEHVFADLGQFLAEHEEVHISINVAAADLQDGAILKWLEAKIAQSKINRKQIWIELTERSLIKLDEVKLVIIQARALGYIIVVDDFGTGFSNLSYLQNLPLDILKIDKSFIDNLGTNSAASDVASHIIEMAKSAHLQIVAEGVEVAAQYNYLNEREVDFIQGYLFYKPISASEFIKLFIY